MKVTQWFDENVIPYNVGIYQTLCNNKKGFGYQYWNGRKWGGFAASKKVAEKRKNWNTCFASDPWRGLADKP